MTVEFIVETAELRLATSQLKANRGQCKDSDFVDVLVSECAATFRAVGTETEVPVEGKVPGSVRVPLRIVDNINRAVKSFKNKKLAFYCEAGAIRVGSFSVKHPDIELGRIPDQRLSLPIDLSVLDTLALTKILTANQIVDEGLRERVEEAWGTRARAVGEALTALQPLGMTEGKLQGLVDAHIGEAAIRLRKSLNIS